MAFNVNVFRNEVLSTTNVKVATKLTAQQTFQKAKDALLEEFETHPVTKELDQETGDNTSGLLGGYGNLFAFIGFRQGDRPTDVVRSELAKLELIEGSQIVIGNKAFFKYKGTSLPFIISQTQLPELEGLSWVDGIENGISNLSQFLSRAVSNPDSKSKQGWQVKSVLRPGTSFTPTPYLTTMFNEFNKKLQSTI